MDALGVENAGEHGHDPARVLLGRDLLKLDSSLPGDQRCQYRATGDVCVGVEQEEFAPALPGGRNAAEHVRLAPEGVREQHDYLSHLQCVNYWKARFQSSRLGAIAMRS